MASVRDTTIFDIGIDGDCGPTVVRVDGELDSFTAGELREGFSRVLDRPAVIIDIRRVPFVDSAGLGALVGGVRRLREAGAGVALCCTGSSVLRLLEVTGFDRMVAVTGTLDEAEAVIAEEEVARSEP